MKINAAGLALLKSFEGCRLKAYQDSVGVWTISYGITGDDVVEGLEITQEEAEQLLADRLEDFEDGVEGLVKKEINGNQFSALVCFAYNVGLHNLKTSLLLRCINMGNPRDAAEQFLRWSKAGGHELTGLLRRRQAERELFLA